MRFADTFLQRAFLTEQRRVTRLHIQYSVLLRLSALARLPHSNVIIVRFVSAKWPSTWAFTVTFTEPHKRRYHRIPNDVPRDKYHVLHNNSSSVGDGGQSIGPSRRFVNDVSTEFRGVVYMSNWWLNVHRLLMLLLLLLRHRLMFCRQLRA